MYNKNVEQMQPVGVQFNMTYIFIATAFAGALIAALIYWLRTLSNTKNLLTTSGTLSSSTAAQNDDHILDNSEDELVVEQPDQVKKKIGVKKAAKLEAKAEKRAAREAMILEREEKKLEQERLDELRREAEEKERKEEEEREEQERLAREEQAKKEHEEYLALAAAFEVEEEGYDPDQAQESEDQLVHFINYINEQKVLLLEDLAARFKMRTKDVIDRIHHLIANGSLVGIIDDRGKFISITHDELKSVAKFIRQRGRVAIDELVVNSNKLINLKPEVKAT